MNLRSAGSAKHCGGLTCPPANGRGRERTATRTATKNDPPAREPSSFVGVAEQRIKQVKLRYAWLFHRSGRPIFACLPGQRHRCQTDLVFSLQGEEVFPS